MALWGKVLDQANIIKSSFDDLEKAVIKATRHDSSIPKEKHVRNLIIFTHERTSPIQQLVLHLTKRLEVPDWIIVLKTLVVFHRLFINGNTRFVEDLKWRGTIFPLARFSDNSTPDAYVQSVFIRKYAQYLEEKVAVYRELKVEFEKDPSLCKGLSLDDSFIRLPKLQRQLDALINCQTSAEAITNVSTALAFEQMLRDSFKLYRGLNDGIITILETYFTLDRKAAVRSLDIYKAFMRETSSIIAMYEMTKKRFTLEVPDLKHAPTTLVTSLEDYVKDLEEGRTPEVRALIEARRAEKSEHAQAHEPNERARPEPKVVSPSSPQPNFNLIDDDIPVKQAAASSMIDPFGVSSVQSSPLITAPQAQFNFQTSQVQMQGQPQQRAQPAAFDPFGSDPFAIVPYSNNPAQLRPNNSAFNDPFATATVQPSSPNYNNPFSSQQQSYEEKAQHIKAAFTPTLQPTTPNPFGSPTSAVSSPNSYPKPNYNVSVVGPTSPQMTMVPYGIQYPNAPANGAVPYGVPPQQQMARQPQIPPYGMGAPRHNNPF